MHKKSALHNSPHSPVRNGNALQSDNTYKKLNKKKFSKFICLLFVAVYVIGTFIHQRTVLADRYAALADCKSRIEDAELEKEALEKQLERVNTDEYLERLAREKLGLVKPNDRVFVDVSKE